MEQRDVIVRLIGALKLVKSIILLAVGFGALELLHRDVATQVHHWIREAHIADDNHYVRLALRELDGTGDGELELVGIGSLAYALLFLVEGTGLLLRRLWAEYVTIIITTSFIPLEIYELVHKQSMVKALIIALNVAIVVYLVLRLRRRHHWPFRRAMVTA